MSKSTIKIPKLKTRVLWGFNPVSRVKPSKKIYSRKNQTSLVNNLSYYDNIRSIKNYHKEITTC